LIYLLLREIENQALAKDTLRYATFRSENTADHLAHNPVLRNAFENGSANATSFCWHRGSLGRPFSLGYVKYYE
jgi:hypothetical protein